MECLQIDWKNLDHTFERDDFYESIQAPKWIDFTAPLQHVDDHEWFCGKAGCTHGTQLLSQPLEDPLLTDPQKNLPLQAPKKVLPPAKSSLSVVPSKRAREVVSSSYSSVSSIKEAFLKHKSLHGAKALVVQSNKQSGKRSLHASENQNPNQACEAQPEVFKVPLLKATEVLAKKLKTTVSKHIPGKSESTLLSELKNRSQSRAVLDVAKSMTSLAKKDFMVKKSTASIFDAKESKSETKEDNTVAFTISHISEPKNKRADASRMPFSAYTSRSAVSSSLALPPRRPINHARSIQDVRHADEKPALCRPPRLVVRKDHKLKVEQVSMPNKLCGDNVTSSHVEGHASSDDNLGRVESNTNQLMLQEQCSASEHDVAYENLLKCDDQPPKLSKEDEENDKDLHALVTEQGQSAEMTLEQHLENLCLSTPGKRVTLDGHGHLEDYDISSKPEPDSQLNESHHVPTTVLPQYGHSGYEEKVAVHEEMLVADCIHSGQFLECPSQLSTLPYQRSQMNENPASSMHITEEQDLLSINRTFEKKDNQLQPVKDWQRNRGLKRKSSELNFKVKCSAKDHKHDSLKVTASVAFASSQLCQQAKQYLMVRSLLKAPPSHGYLDSCKEQHKKLKTTKVQPFKPFRLRTEERGALREMGLGKRENGVSNPQELVHHALKMPSFGQPFRPQRSMKKLTIPKEPNFHTTRARKACTTSHHTTTITLQS
ncbi:hypothetical protein L7F22_046036 [Adiantum nelumboides]|nr:hypothetical protein [Adiantum nelumboides]